MKKERKMLISIVLVLIMLLNCIMPIMAVYAETTGNETTPVPATEITFEKLNIKLYEALKEALTAQNKAFTPNDIDRSIVISTEVANSIEELNLESQGISDLTGLENLSSFTSLKVLDLSGNNLTKDSNLAALNGITTLVELDLSTNQLDDISDISTLISSIEANKGNVDITSQTVVTVVDFEFSENLNPNVKVVKDVELPKILEQAGFLKAAWRHEYGMCEKCSEYCYNYDESASNSHYTPEMTVFPNPVNSEKNKMKVVIAENGIINKGLLKYEIYIHDDATEAGSAANLNPAAKNKLKDSRFTVYVIVHDSEHTAITTPDTNLFKAVKEQLTAGQTVNPDLASYPFEVNSNDEIVYDKCTYVTDTTDTDDLILTVVGEAIPRYILDKSENKVFLYNNGSKGDYYTSIYETIAITTTAADGTITIKEGYKIPHTGENINLYKQVYNDAKTFVINNKVLANKITSLILNNKQIYDLSGIEKFIGLKSYLNVSHNYLSNIDPVYNLKENKDAYAKKLQEKYLYILNTREKANLQISTDKTQEAKDNADAQIKNITTAYQTIVNKLKELVKIPKTVEKEITTKDENGVETKTTEITTNEAYTTAEENTIKEINQILKNIYGEDKVDETTGEQTHVDGYIELLEDALTDISNGIYSVDSYLEDLYDIYNNHYKLTTLLTADLNYQNIEEYTAYLTKVSTEEGAKGLFEAQLGKLTELESNNSLTAFEKNLLENTFYGLDFSDPEKSLSKYFEENQVDYFERIKDFKEIAVYSEMVNYCSMKRMIGDISEEQCYCEEYLKNRIEDFGYEGIDTSVEKDILDKIQNDEEPYGLYGVYTQYKNEEYQYNILSEDRTIKENMASGQYREITDMAYDAITINSAEELAALVGENVDLTEIYNKLEIDGTNKIIKSIKISEGIDLNPDETETLYGYGGYKVSIQTTNGQTQENVSENPELYYYNETMVIAKRLLAASGEVSRYIILPDLKKLDISYNSYLEGIERLSELTALRELSANANYLDDVSVVDWSALHYLRKLELNNNFIKDITPLEVLDHIETLDVSHNLLSGALNFNFTNMQETLENLNLSYNQLDDITQILRYLDFKANGNFANYLAREDTINIDLSNQTINLNVIDPIILRDYPETVNIDLPIIFTQLLAIDVERTEFDYDNSSQVSRIESEGKYATLNTKTVGEKKAVVNVATINGKETCVGDGTQAIINYVVTDATVNEIIVTPNNIELSPEDTQEFTVDVKGEHLKESDKAVRWEVRGNVSQATTISNGILTLGTDETAEAIEVVAISELNGVEGVAVVNVAQRVITEFALTPETAKIIKGESADFTLTIEGENLRDQDKEVEWIVSAEEGTNIAAIYAIENNVLKLSIDEASETGTLTITATSKFDSTKVATATVTVEKREITNISVTPATARIEKGQSQEFTAVVEGQNLRDEDKTIEWSIIGKNSAATQITENGVLTVGKDETATTLTVKATSKFDGTSFGEATIELYERKITEFTMTPETANVGKGQTQQFTVTVNGENLRDEDKAVTWEVTGNTSDETTISENGLLTIGEDETAKTITVKVESNFDSSKVETATVTVKSAQPSVALGYTVDEEYLLGVATKTPVDNFKAELAEDYIVIVKEDGKTVTSGNIKTGMTVEIQDEDGNTVRDENGDLLVYEIIVKGDINKDGVADALDSNIIKAYRNEVAGVNLLEAQRRAADINEDGSIDTNDSKLLLYHRAEVRNYCLDYQIKK